MKYVIMTNPNGFQMADDGTIAEYATLNAAEESSGPGDLIVPVHDTINVSDFQTGVERLPIFNRSNMR